MDLFKNVRKFSFVIAYLCLGLFILIIGIRSTQETPPPDGGAATISDFLRVSGRNLTYRGQTVILRGTNINNLEGLYAEWGQGSGNWIMGTNANIDKLQSDKSDYLKVSELGGNHVRWGMSFSWWKNEKTKFWQVFDNVISWSREANIWLVPVMFTTPSDCYEGYSAYCNIHISSTEQAQLRQFWREVATRYKDEVVIGGYDILNEPLGRAESNWSTGWHNLFVSVVNEIRQVDTNHAIWYTATADAGFFQGKVNDPHIVYEIHDYSPMGMSHCGTTPNKITYPGTSNGKYWSKENMEANTTTSQAWGWTKTNNVPLYIGEWGPPGTCLTGKEAYVQDKGDLYRQLGVHQAHFVWAGGSNHWGLFPQNSTTSPHYPGVLTAVRNSWAGSIKPNFSGTPPPPPPPSGICGDSIVQNPNTSGIAEVCDDGNLVNGDQCSSTCLNSCTAPQTWNGSVCITPVVTQTPFGGTARSLPGKIEVEDFDEGGQDVSYNDTTTANEATAAGEGSNYRSTTGVDIKTSPTNRNVIGYTDAGEWLEYTLSNPTAKAYNLTLNGGSTIAGKTISVSWNGTNLTTVTLPTIANWSAHASITVNNLNIPAGTGVLRLTWDQSDSDLDWFEFASTTTTPPPVCGNGTVEAPEVCDDGNTTNNDQCSSTCQNSCTVPQIWNGTICTTVTPTDPISCKADYNKNGYLEINDFSVFAQNYKKTGINCALDIIGNDCYLNIADFQEFGRDYKKPNLCTISTTPPPPVGDPGQTPYGGTARSLLSKIESEDFDEGGQSIAYNDSTPTENEATTYGEGSTYRNSGVDVKLTADSRKVIGYFANGEWLEYTLTNATAGTYNLGVFGGSNATGRQFKFDWNGTQIAVVDVPVIPNWSAHTLTTVNNVTVPAGTGILRITLIGGLNGADLDWFQFGTGAITPPPAPPPAPPPVTPPTGGTGALRVKSGSSTLEYTNGTRFKIKGVNVEFYRDTNCMDWTTGLISGRTAITDKMKSLSINAIRINYKASNLTSNNTRLTQMMDLIEYYANQGIYSMPSDHAFTGKDLTGYQTTSFPIFQSIVNEARSRGIEDYLIMNPYNEPYGASSSNNTWAHWETQNKTTVNYLRTTLNFNGVIVLDTRNWAASYDSTTMTNVKNYDASLRGGTPNVVFSNHWYPNHEGSSGYNNSMSNAATVPVLIGELGQINPGASALDLTFPRDVLRQVVGTAMPAGHNGVFAWMWKWCDQNTMVGNTAGTESSDFLNLNNYGQMYVTEFYSKSL